MRLIRRIARLRHPGVLKDFTWPTDLTPFGQFNLIYGWNGSGKTTISSIFRALELKTKPAFTDVTLSLENTDIHGDQFPETTLPIRVFNRDFVSENVFPREGGDVPPIYVVGKESVEKQKEVDRLKKDLAQVETDIETAKSNKSSSDRALEHFCFQRATSIREDLRSAGSNRYNNYDKSLFRTRATRMICDGDKASYPLDYKTQDKLRAQIRSLLKPPIEQLSYVLPDLQVQRDTVTAILNRIIVATVIESLRADPGLSTWVHSGLKLQQSHDSHSCLFCGSTLKPDRLSALTAHFSEEHEALLKDIDFVTANLQETLRTTDDLSFPNRAELYEDLSAEYSDALAAAQNAIESVKSCLADLLRALHTKSQRPFETCPLTSNLPLITPGIINDLNNVIQKHNDACVEFNSRIAAARERLENHIVAAGLADFQTLLKETQSQEQMIVSLAEQAGQLKSQIAQLENELVQHRKPADELNEDLKKYLGHKELTLEVKETGYAITRGGISAVSLSEGEKTALALLYYLKCLQDHRLTLNKCIVVLDDPVSSLDANAMYLAFGFIRERTQNAGQLFVLTHNFTFFSQIKNWFHHLPGQSKKQLDKRPARFYMLERLPRSPHRCSTICRLPNLLERYESEYHYLFARVHQETESSEPMTLEHCYALPNMARRLLEGFLAFRKPGTSGQLWEKLKDIPFDEAKKHRIIRFLHTYSHADAIQDPGHDLTLLGEAQAVLSDLMELIRTLDPEHFDAMLKCSHSDEAIANDTD